MRVLIQRVSKAGVTVAGDRVAGIDFGFLILLDIGLPDITGVEVFSELRRDPLTEKIPVIAVSAYATKEDQSLFHRVGFDGYISKPINIRTIRSEIHRILESTVSP